MHRTHKGGRIDLNEVIREFKGEQDAQRYSVFEIIPKTGARSSSTACTPLSSGRIACSAPNMVEMKSISHSVSRSFGTCILAQTKN